MSPAFFLVSSIFFHAYTTHTIVESPLYLLLFLLQQRDAVRQQLDVLLGALATHSLVGKGRADCAVVLLGLLVHVLFLLLVRRELLLERAVLVLICVHFLPCEVVLLPDWVLH